MAEVEPPAACVRFRVSLLDERTVPDNPTVCVPTVSVTIRVALGEPVVVGEKVMLMVQLAPTATGAVVQVSAGARENSVLLVPVTVNPDTVRSAAVLLVNTTESGLLTVLIACCGKFRNDGLKVTPSPV